MISVVYFAYIIPHVQTREAQDVIDTHLCGCPVGALTHTAHLAAGDFSDAAVEEFAAAVKRTPTSEPLDSNMLSNGLQNLDSRGLAALLKELAKGYHGKRAREVR